MAIIHNVHHNLNNERYLITMLDSLILFTEVITGSAMINDSIKNKPWFKEHPRMTKLFSYILFPLASAIIVIVAINLYEILL